MTPKNFNDLLGRLSLFILLVLPNSSFGEILRPVEEAKGFCSAQAHSYCFEWTVADSTSLYFLAIGDEDFISYAFYRRIPDQRYVKILEVYPVIAGEVGDAHVYPGYPWDIVDLDATSDAKTVHLMATFCHCYSQESIDGEILWRTSIPAVLFRGAPSQREIKLSGAAFVDYDLDRARPANVAPHGDDEHRRGAVQIGTGAWPCVDSKVSGQI